MGPLPDAWLPIIALVANVGVWGGLAWRHRRSIADFVASTRSLFRLPDRLPEAPPPSEQLFETIVGRYDLQRRSAIEADGTIAGVRIGLRLDAGRVVLWIAQGVPAGLAIEPRVSTSASERMPGVVVTGDPAFDDAVVATGPTPVMRGLLDRETRARILRLGSGGPWSIGAGGIRFIVPPGGTMADMEVRDAIEIATRLSAELPPEARLAAIVADRLEPTPVREHGFDTLAVHAPESPDLKRVSNGLSSDPVPSLRFRGALRLGDGEAMARVAIEAPSIALVSRACQWLADHRAAALPDVLQQRLRLDANAELIQSLVPLAARIHAPASIFEAPLESDSERTREAAARAILSLGNAGESTLLALIRAVFPDPIRIDAIAQLAVRGTTAAVQPLRELESGDVRIRAMKAVKEIQARAGGERGQLSVAGDPNAGQLSEPDAGGGALSMPKAARKREEAG